MLLDLAGSTERFTCGDDRVVALPHGLGGEVGVATGAVPVALDRLGRDRRVDVEVLGDPVQQVAGHPHVIANLNGAHRADLKLPLAQHHLGIGARDGQAGGQAGIGVSLHDLATGDLDRTHPAVIRTLGGGVVVPGSWPPHRSALLEERVLLLHAEPRLLVGVALGHLDCGRPPVGRVRLHRVGHQHLAQHQLVVAAPDRVGGDEHRAEHAIAVGPLSLVGRGTVKAPHAHLGTIGEDLGLGTHQRHGLGAVDPDVLGAVGHGDSSSWRRSTRRGMAGPQHAFAGFRRHCANVTGM